MIEYKVLTGMSPTELSRLVEASIHDFWMPQGGVALSLAKGDWYYAQAMVRTPEHGDPHPSWIVKNMGPGPLTIGPGQIEVMPGHAVIRPSEVNKTSTHELVKRTMKPAVPGVVLSDDEKRELEVMMAEVRRREQQNAVNDARNYSRGVPQIYRGLPDEETTK